MPQSKVYASKARKPMPRRAPAKRPSKAPSARSKYEESKYLAPFLGTAGGALGGYFGGPPGALAGLQAGQLVGHGIKRLTGFGDYKVAQNTLMTGAPPSVSNSKQGSGGAVRISHKEYIGDILSSASASTFSIEKFPIQPGSPKTFPWLSTVANQFQEYELNGMIFHFRSMSADALNSTNTALGSVMLSTDYNAVSPAFASKSEMENAQYANSIKPSESVIHAIECARQSSVLSNLYVRSDEVVSSANDIRFYDLGNFYIASTGMQGTSVNLGELWVSYDVSLYKPRLWGTLGENIQWWNGYSVTGVTNALPLGTADLVISDNSNITVSIDLTNQILTLPSSSAPKSYIMRTFWRGTRTASLNPPGTSYTNALTTITPFMTSAGLVPVAAIGAPDTNASSDSIFLIDEVAFQTSGQNKVPTIDFNASGTLPASVVVFNIQIMQIPNTYGFS